MNNTHHHNRLLETAQTSSQITLPKILLALWSWSYTVLLTILEGGSKRFFSFQAKKLTKYKYVLKASCMPSKAIYLASINTANIKQKVSESWEVSCGWDCRSSTSWIKLLERASTRVWEILEQVLVVLVLVLFVCGESKELEDTGTKPKGFMLLKIDCAATWMLQKRCRGVARL